MTKKVEVYSNFSTKSATNLSKLFGLHYIGKVNDSLSEKARQIGRLFITKAHDKI
jgi:hypothetical protein